MTAPPFPTPPGKAPFNDDGALAAWIAARPESEAETLRRLDGVEDWPSNRGPCTAAALDGFAAALAAAPEDGVRALRDAAARDRLMRVLASMPASRCVAFADWLVDAAGPAAAALFDGDAAEGAPAGIAVRQRLLHVHRRRLLDEIFDADRIARVRDAIRDARNELA